MNNIIQTVKFFVEKHNLEKKKIVVAFSGGYDSSCLLHVCYKLGLNIVAAHLNHNWRGAESAHEASKCANFCSQFDIDFYSETLPDTVEKTETAAREARYEFFERVAKLYSSDCVFTAHNFDDNAETVFYRIIKGTGIYGLGGIKEERGIFYRPLLSIPRMEIEKYCLDNNLHPNIDSSNSNTKYKRNFIRHEIFPMLETINKDVRNALNSLSKIAAEENSIVEDLLPNVAFLDTQTFLAYSLPVKKRVIHKLLNTYDIEYTREKIENIEQFILENFISKSGKIMSLTTELMLFVNDKYIKVISSTSDKKEDFLVDKCGLYGDLSIELCNIVPQTFPDDSEGIAYVDLSGIDFPLQFRSRCDGDIISPLGVGGTQKLKQYLNDRKIPNYKKASMHFLCCKNEVLWVPFYGISERIKVKSKPTHVLKIIK